MFNSMIKRCVWHFRDAVLLLGACGMAWMAASCGSPPVTKDFSVLSTATRIEVHDVGVRPLSIVTDPERIKVARDFIKQYEKGWKKFRLQGAAIPRRRFDFWNGDRYLGDFGISPNFLTTEGLYQEAPAEEIAKIAALFELKWPPQ
jgi:hypothetical protein